MDNRNCDGIARKRTRREDRNKIAIDKERINEGRIWHFLADQGTVL